MAVTEQVARLLMRYFLISAEFAIKMTQLPSVILFYCIQNNDFFCSPPSQQNILPRFGAHGIITKSILSKVKVKTTWLKIIASSRRCICFILLTHEGSHPGRNSNSVRTSSAGPAPRVVQTIDSVRVHPGGYTLQLLTLYQHRANN